MVEMQLSSQMRVVWAGIFYGCPGSTNGVAKTLDTSIKGKIHAVIKLAMESQQMTRILEEVAAPQLSCFSQCLSEEPVCVFRE